MQVPDLLGIVSYYTHDDAVGRKQVLKAMKIKPTDKRLVKNLGEAFLFLFFGVLGNVRRWLLYLWFRFFQYQIGQER